MPSRRDVLERGLAEAAAAAERSARRVRRASAERLARAMAAPTLREQLAALDDPILLRGHRRRLREKVGVPLAPQPRTAPTRRRGLMERLRLWLARRRPNPISLMIGVALAGALVAAAGLAWSHTGRGVRLTRSCGPVLLTLPRGGIRSTTLPVGEAAVLRGRQGSAVRIALWTPLAGYAIALVPEGCLVPG